ncbi:MAG: VWA domain-containing protein [Chloroflexota bacterium]
MAVKLFAPWVLSIFAVLGLVWYAQKIALRRQFALAVRIGLLVLLLFSYFALNQSKEQSRQAGLEIMLIDVSDSIDQQSLDEAWDFAEDWIESGAKRIVIPFGEQPGMMLSGQWPQVGTQESNLAAALEAAHDLISGQNGKIIIASDGVVLDHTEIEKQLIEMSNDNVDFALVHLLGKTMENDLILGEVLGPSGVWENSEFNIHLPIQSPAAGQVSVGITVNGTYQEEILVKVDQGDNLAAIRLRSGDPGIMLVDVTVKIDNDQFEHNNSIYAAIEVFPPPQVLLVSRGTQAADKLSQALADEGLEIDTVSPYDLTTSRDQLAGYQAILLFDLLSQDLNYEQMISLESFVLDYGRSLVVLGGRNSYNLGGYENTRLEPLLPVDLTAPERIERHPTTYVMVLDRSGSMAQDEDSDISPIELTKEAAARAIESLRPEDYLGVLTFNSYTNWDVDITEVGDGISLRLALDAVSQIKASGGTEISQALQEALAKIIETKPTEYKHILLMSDGASDNDEDTLEKFEILTAIGRRQNISISTIALGYESDEETLSFIAQEGNGRFYQVFDPADLPGVMVSESKAAHSENIQVGETNSVAGIQNHPVLNGIEMSNFPRIFGYNAVSSKVDFGAEDILLSGNFDDPLLSSWQVGHGHVVAWMGDMGAEWVPGMVSWSQAGEFWRQVIQYSLPDPRFDFSSVELLVDQQQAQVTFKVFDLDGFPINHLAPEFIYTDQSNLPSRFLMLPIGPGEYQIEFPIPQFGGYRGVIQYEINGKEQEIGVPFTVNYPVEWQFKAPKVGKELLQKWTEFPGINSTSFGKLQNSTENEVSLLGKENSFEILLGLIIILWPLEIAFRRWKMPWRRP